MMRRCVRWSVYDAEPLSAGSLQVFQKRNPFTCERCFQLLRAVAVGAGPRLSAVLVPTIAPRVGIFDVDELEVLLPVRPLLLEGLRTEADFHPLCASIGEESRLLHVVQVLVAGDGARA